MLSAAESSLSVIAACFLLRPTHLACRSRVFAFVYAYVLVHTFGSIAAASVAVNSFFATASSNVLAVCFATVVATVVFDFDCVLIALSIKFNNDIKLVHITIQCKFFMLKNVK